MSGGTYQCFHCCTNSVIWDNDFNYEDFGYEDFGYEGDGIVHVCHCTNCGAQIEYKVPLDSESEGENENGKECDA